MLHEFFKDKKNHYVDESEWVIFENTHEAIIDQDAYGNALAKLPDARYAALDEQYAKEQEEQRKAEQRKDRLHQNYLRRKAAGKVAADYEKTRAKKKAEIDAKKNALRSKDITKGVFIPASTITKKEPKKVTRKATRKATRKTA